MFERARIYGSVCRSGCILNQRLFCMAPGPQYGIEAHCLARIQKRSTTQGNFRPHLQHDLSTFMRSTRRERGQPEPNDFSVNCPAHSCQGPSFSCAAKHDRNHFPVCRRPPRCFARLRPTYDTRILMEKRRGLCPVTLLPALFGIPSKGKRIVYCNNPLFEFDGQDHLLWNGK